MAACPIAGGSFPDGQKYLGAPQKIAGSLPPEGEGQWGEPQRYATYDLGQAVMDIAVGPSQEASQSLSGGKAGHYRTGKRGCRFVHSFRSIIRQLVSSFAHAH